MKYLIWFIPLAIMAFIIFCLMVGPLFASLVLALILALVGVGKLVLNNWAK